MPLKKKAGAAGRSKAAGGHESSPKASTVSEVSKDGAPLQTPSGSKRTRSSGETAETTGSSSRKAEKRDEIMTDDAFEHSTSPKPSRRGPRPTLLEQVLPSSSVRASRKRSSLGGEDEQSVEETGKEQHLVEVPPPPAAESVLSGHVGGKSCTGQEDGVGRGIDHTAHGDSQPVLPTPRTEVEEREDHGRKHVENGRGKELPVKRSSAASRGRSKRPRVQDQGVDSKENPTKASEPQGGGEQAGDKSMRRQFALTAESEDHAVKGSEQIGEPDTEGAEEEAMAIGFAIVKDLEPRLKGSAEEEAPTGEDTVGSQSSPHLILSPVQEQVMDMAARRPASGGGRKGAGSEGAGGGGSPSSPPGPASDAALSGLDRGADPVPGFPSSVPKEVASAQERSTGGSSALPSDEWDLVGTETDRDRKKKLRLKQQLASDARARPSHAPVLASLTAPAVAPAPRGASFAWDSGRGREPPGAPASAQASLSSTMPPPSASANRGDQERGREREGGGWPTKRHLGREESGTSKGKEPSGPGAHSSSRPSLPSCNVSGGGGSANDTSSSRDGGVRQPPVAASDSAPPAGEESFVIPRWEPRRKEVVQDLQQQLEAAVKDCRILQVSKRRDRVMEGSAIDKEASFLRPYLSGCTVHDSATGEPLHEPKAPHEGRGGGRGRRRWRRVKECNVQTLVENQTTHAMNDNNSKCAN
ncbi:hypothetical protein Naga_100010g25 [Nannochloropsis gaditana]|uniref:Uncharacterized protein n=1 Tax=Nannochloropsis gaditana TaxID=72520 RepID=W7TJA1_9STRA|nr:hypothetical protein Naga_100010g25 [Nannochloropsis gaditana]